MKMEVLPPFWSSSPQPSLFELQIALPAIHMRNLHEAREEDGGVIWPHGNHLDCAHGALNGIASGMIEIELVKRKPLYQLPIGLRFVAGQVIGHQAGVGFPILVRNGIQKLLVEGDEFLFHGS